MPTRKAPSPEEAKKMFQHYPYKKLSSWADDWGVTVERVRQIKIDGKNYNFEINYDTSELIILNVIEFSRQNQNNDNFKNLNIIDVGSYDMNGSIRKLIPENNYTGIDIVKDLINLQNQLSFLVLELLKIEL